MMKIPIKIGPPVEGNDFYGRKKELQDAWERHILQGVSLLLSAPRRVGKSSFAKKMLDTAKEKGWKTLYLDLQGLKSERDFVRLFKEELKKEKWWNKAGDIILKIFDSIKETEVAGNKVSINSDVWRSDAYGKIKQLINDTEETLIVMDEAAIFLNHLLTQENGKEKVEFFLEWLRSFRQTSGTKVCWIFCSSVGIENFVSMHQLSKHLNDLYLFPIGAFPEHEAKDFISCLAVDENVKFTKDHIQHILDKLGWYLPFFIKILVDQINSLCSENKQLSNETIDEAYNLLIAQSYFNTWDERLNDYNQLENNARKILKLCALSNGESRENLLANLAAKKSDVEKTEKILSELLVMLKNDGYLAEHNGKYIFRSPLLRDFWYGRYVK